MKDNMKGALLTASAPMAFSFLSGVFGWYMDDGVYTFIGFIMMIGLGWAWYVELNRGK